MITPIENTLASKFVHVALVTLIAAYIVFVKKLSVVESVSSSTKIVNTPSTSMKGPFNDPSES